MRGEDLLLRCPLMNQIVLKKYYHRVGCSFIFWLDSGHLMAAVQQGLWWSGPT